MKIELLYGPLDGKIVTLAPGWPVPNKIGLMDDEGSQRHWYEIVEPECVTAVYILPPIIEMINKKA